MLAILLLTAVVAISVWAFWPSGPPMMLEGPKQ
jgi:hypothetical protein